MNGRVETVATTPRKAPNTISRPELLDGGHDLRFRELVNNLLAFSARHEAIRAGHGAYIGLPAPQYTILIAAAHRSEEGPVRIKDLAEQISVSQTFITMELKKLYKLGLLRKTRNEQDSRVVDIYITDKGMELLEDLSVVQRQVNDQQFAKISREEFDELLRLTKLLINNSDKALTLQAYLTHGGDLRFAGRSAAKSVS